MVGTRAKTPAPPEPGEVFALRLTRDLADIIQRVVEELEARNQGLKFSRADALRHIIASYKTAPPKGGRS